MIVEYRALKGLFRWILSPLKNMINMYCLCESGMAGVDNDACRLGAVSGSKFGQALLEVDLQAGWGLSVAWSPAGADLYDSMMICCLS